jgi:hypothetical protein
MKLVSCFPIQGQNHHILGDLGAPTAVPLVPALQAFSRLGQETPRDIRGVRDAFPAPPIDNGFGPA